MTGHSRGVRPSKKTVIVIDDDESTREEPVVKSEVEPVPEESTREQPVVKREAEPVPSSDVAEPQPVLHKACEEKFQRLCRVARTEELRLISRAEAAESRLDSKYEILGQEGLEDVKKRADHSEKRLEEVSTQLEDEQRKVSELARQNEGLKTELAARDDCELQKRIDELTLKLAQYEGGVQQPQQLQPIQQTNARVKQASSTKKRRPQKRVVEDSDGEEEPVEKRSMSGDEFYDNGRVKRRSARCGSKSVKYTEEEEAEKEDPSCLIRLYNADCDGVCGNGLSSASGRFRCTQCADFDLCRACKRKGVHSSTHHELVELFEEIWTPTLTHP